jgi:protocatechuate 3,4-dioxygenase beta subunit
LLSRRQLLAGAAGAFTFPRLYSATPECTLVPEQEEGPYYVDFRHLRRDLTEGKPGVPLALRVLVMDAKRCTPLENAALDLWHCDALGVYSGYTAMGGGEGGFGGRGKGRPFPGGGRGRGPSDSLRFLRGVQLTDRYGIAAFNTIYPGWYAGRTVHIHIKVHVGGRNAGETYQGGHVAHTGQMFFPEDVTAEIARLEPYVQHSYVHRTLHSEDHVVRAQGGAVPMIRLERMVNGRNDGGFIATVALGVDPDATPRLL